MDLVVFGTNKGTLRVFLWPFTPIEKRLPEFIEISVCSGSITCIKHSVEIAFLFVGGSDGSIYFISF